MLAGIQNLLLQGAQQSAAAGSQRHGACRAVNVPHQLLKGLEQHAAATGARPLLIQLSSDQVYAGTKAFWTEADTCEAVNVYGRSKLEAESVIKARRRAQLPVHVLRTAACQAGLAAEICGACRGNGLSMLYCAAPSSTARSHPRR